MNRLRSVVSGNRNRFRDSEFDLDLTYITPRIIAMSFPGDGLEGMYRNNIKDVSTFLNRQHPDSYLVLNLSERLYDYSLFDDRVFELGFPDHHSPPVEVAWTLCLTMHGWLQASKHHVVAVHCLAGKGRTGVIIACYLLFSGYFFQRENLLVYISNGGSAVSSNLSKGIAALKATMLPKGPLKGEHSGSIYLSDNEIKAVLPPNALHTDTLLHQAFLEAVVRWDAEKSTFFPLPPPSELTFLTLHWFRLRRGEGVSYASQERTVRYFARVVHSTIVSNHNQLVSDYFADSESKEGSVKVSEEEKHLMVPVDLDVATQSVVYVHVDTLSRMRNLRKLPLPKARRIRISRLILNRIPRIPWGDGTFCPVLVITSAPYQGVETKVFYSSSWHSQSETYGSSSIGMGDFSKNGELGASSNGGGRVTFSQLDEAIAFHLNIEVQGDILFSFKQYPENKEVFRFAIHSGFLSVETGAEGLLRLTRDDIDLEKKMRAPGLIDPAFFLDLVYSNIDSSDDYAKPTGPFSGKSPCSPSSPVSPAVTKNENGLSPAFHVSALVAGVNFGRQMSDSLRSVPNTPEHSSTVVPTGLPPRKSASSTGLLLATHGILSPASSLKSELNNVNVTPARLRSLSMSMALGGAPTPSRAAEGLDTTVVTLTALKLGQQMKTWKRRVFVLSSSQESNKNGVGDKGRSLSLSIDSSDSQIEKEKEKDIDMTDGPSTELAQLKKEASNDTVVSSTNSNVSTAASSTSSISPNSSSVNLTGLVRRKGSVAEYSDFDRKYVKGQRTLSYFKSITDIAPKGSLPLDSTCYVEIGFKNIKDLKPEFPFRIVAHGRVLELKTESESERARWISALTE